MLTNQHCFAKRILEPAQRRQYQIHMCGLCHALGDDYGLMARLLTNHEMTLLNMLTEAQSETSSEITVRRCPLYPARKVAANQSPASRFAAAAAVLLASVSVEDDIQDGRGWRLISRSMHMLLSRPRSAALQTLAEMGFDPEIFTGLNQRQKDAEQATFGDAIAPSSSASIFAMTARLAENPRNEESLAAIGKNYGAYIYLLDAFRDYPKDMEQGDYNPLRRFSLESNGYLTLSQAGIRWLTKQLEDILVNIRLHVGELQLHRYREAIITLLCQPIERLVVRLTEQTTSSRVMRFTKLETREILKSALFMTPALVSASEHQATRPIGDYIAMSIAEEEEPQEKKKKRGRRREEGSSGDSCAYSLWYCPPGGSDYGCGEDGMDCNPSDGDCGAGGMDCNPTDGDCGGADCNPGDADCSGLGDCDLSGCDLGGIDC